MHVCFTICKGNVGLLVGCLMSVLPSVSNSREHVKIWQHFAWVRSNCLRCIAHCRWLGLGPIGGQTHRSWWYLVTDFALVAEFHDVFTLGAYAISLSFGENSRCRLFHIHMQVHRCLHVCLQSWKCKMVVFTTRWQRVHRWSPRETIRTCMDTALSRCGAITSICIFYLSVLAVTLRTCEFVFE